MKIWYCIFLVSFAGASSLFCQTGPSVEEKVEYGRRAQIEFENLYYNQGRSSDALEVLESWLDFDDSNPELYINFFNFYLNEGTKSGIAIENNPGNSGQSLAITDPNTNEIIGYLRDSKVYNYDQVNLALQYLNTGITLALDRLDMYFGKIHVLNQIKDFENSAGTIITVLDRAIVNQNNWYWSRNEHIDDGLNFLLDNLNDYYSQWINERSPEALDALRRATARQVELFPGNVYAYNFNAYAYILGNEFDHAVSILLAAEQISPSDMIIINNIARLYEQLGERERAIEYYNKMRALGNAAQRQYAEDKLEQLQ